VLFEKLTSCFTKEEMAKFDTLLEKLMKNADKLVQSKESPQKRKSYRDQEIKLNRGLNNHKYPA